MKLFFDRDLKMLVVRPGFTTPLTALSFKRGDEETLELQYCRGAVLEELAADPEIAFGIKETLAGERLAAAVEWALAQGLYSAAFNTNTVGLLAALGDADSKVFLGELTFSDANGGPTSSQTLAVTVSNDVLKEDDGTPEELPGPEEWLSARGVRYDEAQSLSPEEQLQARENIGAMEKTAAAVAQAIEEGAAEEREDIRAGLAVGHSSQIGFFDDFSRADLYPDGKEIEDGVTLPQYGSAWLFKPNDSNQPLNTKPFVLGGRLHHRPRAQGYLAAHATPVNARQWSVGFEFIRESTFGNDPRHNFTITLGKAPLVSASTHNAWGKIHVNMDMAGVTSTAGLAFGGAWALTGDAANDRFALGAYSVNSPELTLVTGDAVGIAGTLPPELPAGVGYFVIRNGGFVQLATTKQNALNGVAIPFSTNGAGITMERQLVVTNRAGTGLTTQWVEPETHSRMFQGSTVGNVLGTQTAHPFAVGDPVMVEGDDLPEPLVSGPYYISGTPSRYGVTLSATRGGSTITLTDNGSPNQIIRGKAYSEARSFIPYGTTNMVICTREDDTISFTLVGAGTITFYARNLDEVLGAQGEEMGFYWQTPTGIVSGLTYPSIYSLVSAWIDAPSIQRRKLEVHYSALMNMASSASARLNRLSISPQNTTRDPTTNASFDALNWGLSLEATQQIQTPAETVGKRRRRRQFGVAGGYVSFLGYADNDGFAVAEMTVRDNIITAPVSPTIHDSGLRTLVTAGIAEVTLPGDTETYEFGGLLSGASYKAFEIYTIWGTLLLQSGDMSAISGMFEIRLTRKVFAGTTSNEVWHASLQVGNSIVSTKRTLTTWPVPGTNRTLSLNAASGAVGSVTLDYVRRTISAHPDTTFPTISALSPADNASGVAVGADLVMTFNKPVAFGSGRFRIRNLTDLVGGQPTETVIAIPSTQAVIATAPAQTAIAFNQLTVNPAANLLAGKNYAVRIDPGAILDFSGNPYAGFDNDTTWNFST